MLSFMVFFSRRALRKLKIMSGIYLVALVVTCFVYSIFPAETYAATVKAASCSRSDVNTAITNASRGDTVIVPACSETTWDSGITIAKSITLQGAGVGSTNIKSNLSSTSSWLISVVPASILNDTNTDMRIKGFTFNLNNRGQGIQVVNQSLTPLNKLIIENNAFTNCAHTVSDQNTMTITGTVYGVIHSNMFSGGVYIGFYGISSDGNAGKISWNNQTWTPGSYQAMYFENNTVVFYSSVVDQRNRQIITASHGSRYVARYNTFDLTSAAYWKQIFDVHGNENGTWGGFGAELYGNKVIPAEKMTVNEAQYMGGKGFNFYNWVNTPGVYGNATIENKERVIDKITYNGTTSPVAWPTTTSYTCPTGSSYLYPSSASCASDGQPQHVWNQYNWQNRYGLATGTLFNAAYNSEKYYPSSTWGPYVGGDLIENYHYWNSNSNCSATGTCSTGVGCGKSVPSGNCTTGTAYWVTSDSCSDLTNYTGSNHASTIEGTLYRCGPTNTWTPFYSPYTYPHPLRSGQSEISAPKGFKVASY